MQHINGCAACGLKVNAREKKQKNKNKGSHYKHQAKLTDVWDAFHSETCRYNDAQDSW